MEATALIEKCQKHHKEHKRACKYYKAAQHTGNMLSILFSVCSIVLSSFSSEREEAIYSVIAAITSALSATLCTWLQISDFPSLAAKHESMLNSYSRIELLIEREIASGRLNEESASSQRFLDMIVNMMTDTIGGTPVAPVAPVSQMEHEVNSVEIGPSHCVQEEFTPKELIFQLSRV
jgi:hypothetical protein